MFKRIIKNLAKKVIPTDLQEHIKCIIYPVYSKSYSQEGEDRILLRIFERKEKGFYVDVGAHHPLRFSNTYLFYKRGWRGINIDANPESIKLFMKYRPKDINLNIGVGRPRKLTYHIFEEPAVNTFNEELAREYAKHYRLVDKMVLEVKPLSEILDNYMPKNTDIDFMNIDVEGMDLEVLESNNWDKYRPKIILVEILNISSIEDLTKHEITKFLQKKGYVPFAKSFNTCFFKEG